MQEGEKASLRSLSESDLDQVSAWDSDPEIVRLMGDVSRSPEESRARYVELMHDRNSVVMGIEAENGDLIGVIELTEIAWRSGDAELIVRIGESSCWNRGYGSAAVRATLRMAFEEMNLNRVYLRVCADNSRAVRCYEKCGFVREGAVTRRLGDLEERRTIVLMTVMRTDFIRIRMVS